MENISLNSFAEGVVAMMPVILREFARREDNPLVHGKISMGQMVVLDLAGQRPVTMSEIARALSVRKSSASVLVDRLVRMGMLARRHDEEDRRIVWMRVTPKGRRVLSRIRSQKRDSFKAIFGPLSARERAQYLNILKKVRTRLVQPSLAALTLFCLTLSTPAMAGGQAGILTLQDAYQKALKRSESVAITREEIELAQARFYRSFNYFLPQVRYEITRFEHDINEDSGGGSQQNFGRRTTPAQKFVFSQPLFSGLREIAALTGTGADKKAQHMKYQRAKELLFVDVMEAYYTALNGQKDVEVLYAVHRMMSRRVKDLRDRVALGRSRESELKTSLADIKILQSDILASKRLLQAAGNLLEYYVGESLDDKVFQDENGERTDLLFGPGKELTRSDVVQYEQEFVVAQRGRLAANASYLPTISLDGNYYTKRVGFQSGNDWDVTLKFDIPVFEVADVLGEIKEADSNLVSAKLAYEQKKRQATLEARDAFEEFESDRRAEQALSEARSASQANYEILQKEFRTSLVSNLDVLDALRSYQETHRRYELARYGLKKSYWRLKLALGEIPKEVLG